MVRRKIKWGKRKASAANLRKKGHDLERYVASTLRDIYPHAKTSRSESRTMDDCGVDVVNVPFLIQCKSGYETPRPRYERLMTYIDERIVSLPNYEILYANQPRIVVHKLNGHSKESSLTVMKYEDFLELVRLSEIGKKHV